jgi:membrane fusion protein (multidrug efflux system)
MAEEEKSQTKAEPATPQSPAHKPLNRRVTLVVGAVVVCVLALGALIWWLHARNYESTDDAFIDAHVVRIAPRIAGQVRACSGARQSARCAGDLLVEIDRADPNRASRR